MFINECPNKDEETKRQSYLLLYFGLKVSFLREREERERERERERSNKSKQMVMIVYYLGGFNDNSSTKDANQKSSF